MLCIQGRLQEGSGSGPKGALTNRDNIPTTHCCSQAKNVGDAASRAGSAAGRQVEAAGQKVGDCRSVPRRPARTFSRSHLLSSSRQKLLKLLSLQVGSETLKEEGRGLQAKQY